MRSSSALIAVALTFLACGDLDVVTANYATLDEARRAGAVERGWVPQGLPTGTYEIREAHDLDSNQRWGLFSFPTSDREDLKELLEEEEISVEGITVYIPPRIEWWPVLLRGGLNADRIRATGLRAYRSRDRELLVLVNWEQGRAYYSSLER